MHLLIPEDVPLEVIDIASVIDKVKGALRDTCLSAVDFLNGLYKKLFVSDEKPDNSVETIEAEISWWEEVVKKVDSTLNDLNVQNGLTFDFNIPNKKIEMNWNAFNNSDAVIDLGINVGIPKGVGIILDFSTYFRINENLILSEIIGQPLVFDKQGINIGTLEVRIGIDYKY